MTVIEKIKADTKEAMFAKDMIKTTVLRGVSAAFMNEALAKKVPELTDDDAMAVIRRLVKQRKDSIEQFEKGGRPELAAAEKQELGMLETYLPAQMKEADLVKIAEALKTKMGITDKTKAGQLMGAVMKEAKGNADGGLVKKVVDGLFS
jgi:uncharacterized protein